MNTEGAENSIHLAIDLLLFQHDPRIPVSSIVSEAGLLITRYMPTKADILHYCALKNHHTKKLSKSIMKMILKTNLYMLGVFIWPNKKPDYQSVQFWCWTPGTHFHIPTGLFVPQSNMERMCRSVEDQFNEIKAKDDQQTQLIHDLNMQKARLQTQNGEDGLPPGPSGDMMLATGNAYAEPHLFGRGAEPPSRREGGSGFATNQKQAGPHPAAGGAQETAGGRDQGKVDSLGRT